MSKPLPRHVDLLGTRFDNLTLAQTIAEIDAMVAEERRERADGRGRTRMVGVKDVALTIRAAEDPALVDFYDRAELLVVDGRGLFLASRLLRVPLAAIVGGPPLFYEAMRRSADAGYAVYVVGATEEVLGAAVASLQRSYPGLRIVGSRNGYFRGEEMDRFVRELRAAAPDIIVVGMATPHRERFIDAARRAQVPSICLAVGGMLDVASGTKHLAPTWVSNSGLEWLYRAVQEPRRLFPRYLRTHSKFALLVAGALLGGRRAPARAAQGS